MDDSIGAVFELLESRRGDMQRLLERLVAVPTENPPGTDYARCVDVLDEAALALGLRTERVPSSVDPVRTALRAWTAPQGRAAAKGSAVYFHGHYDVVPAVTRSQFVPRVDGDTLFGRGSTDMKSGLVAMLYAAHALAEARAIQRGRVELLFVPDEETGGAAGTAALAAHGKLGIDAVGMLLPEPTSGRVWHASRGAISLDVTVRGRAAHVALQHHGVNAVERAMPLLDRLFALKRDLDARQSVLLVGGRVNAGTNFNLVPDECRFTIDRRTNPDEDFEAEKATLYRLMDDAKRTGVDLEVAVIQEGRSSSTPVDHAFGRALTQAVTDVCGELPVVEICPGLLETRFYANLGIPAYAYGPGILAVAHGPNEFVKLSAMMSCAKVYALTAIRALHASWVA